MKQRKVEQIDDEFNKPEWDKPEPADYKRKEDTLADVKRM
jgi:hypothetical protein